MSEKSRSKMQAVLDFINEYNAEYGYAPTVREICSKLDIKSTASAYYYMEKLNEEGPPLQVSEQKQGGQH